jgi:biotin carboxylase
MILGASRYYIRCIRAARRLGLRAVVLDRDPAAPGLALADTPLAVDITDIPAAVDAARRLRVDAVVALNDFGVPTAAAVAQALGLPGLRPGAAANATDKARMRTLWAAAGVPSAEFEVVRTLDGLEAAARRLGLPLVVKPADSRGGGSRGVRMVRAMRELPEAFAFAGSFYDDPRIVAEQCLRGSEHSLETFTFEGRTHVLAIGDKEKTPEPYRVDRSVIYPTALAPGPREAACAAARDAVRALGIDHGPAHVELCVTARGPRLFEVGARCGGGGTPDPIVPYVTGVDVFAAVLDLALGRAPRSLEPTRSRGCVYRFLTPAPGVVRRVAGLEEVRAWEGVLDCEVFPGPGDTVRPVRVGADRAGFVIAGGADRQAALDLAARAEAHIRVETAPPGKQRLPRPKGREGSHPC